MRRARATPHKIDKQSASFRHRNALTLMSVLNGKTPKGETSGYLSGILYLAPHTSVSPKTLCPYSTPACREMCLAGAGLNRLPRATGARAVRTMLWAEHRERFIEILGRDLERLCELAAREGMTPVARLNGTSDLIWETLAPDLLRRFSRLQFMDYTKVPLHLRRTTPNYHLTYSIGSADDWPRAIGYLRAGHSVAVVAPEVAKAFLVGQEVDIGPHAALLIDGDENDLRFLDQPSSIVLLRPKGLIRTDLVRTDILSEIRHAIRSAA